MQLQCNALERLAAPQRTAIRREVRRLSRPGNNMDPGCLMCEVMVAQLRGVISYGTVQLLQAPATLGQLPNDAVEMHAASPLLSAA